MMSTRIAIVIHRNGRKEKSMYDLVGVDGNAFAVMGYTGQALRETGHGDLVSKMREEAMSGDYNNLLRVCMKYIDIANEEEE